MARRFHVPEGWTSGAVVILSAGESHHLATVLRAEAGDRFELFDGRGRRALAEVSEADPRAARLRVVFEYPNTPVAVLADLVIATAVPKGERFDWLVEKATELGVARLVPIVTARSVVEPRETKLERLRATIVAASKQCGRTQLMELADLTPWRKVVDELLPGRNAVIAHPTGKDLGSVWSMGGGATDCMAVIGPEGGLTEDEVTSARSAGAVAVRLGVNILRTETAAIALASAWTLRSRPADNVRPPTIDGAAADGV